jgi:hypothetical protein
MFYTTIAMNLKSHHDPVGKSHFTPTPNSLWKYSGDSLKILFHLRPGCSIVLE